MLVQLPSIVFSPFATPLQAQVLTNYAAQQRRLTLRYIMPGRARARWLRAGQTLFLRLRSEKRARQQIGINIHQERAEHSRVSLCGETNALNACASLQPSHRRDLRAL